VTDSRRPFTPDGSAYIALGLCDRCLRGIAHPQGENQIDCELDAVERIEAALRFDHVATCGWPYDSMCPRCFPPLMLIEGV
jgi:hypothetical protein